MSLSLLTLPLSLSLPPSLSLSLSHTHTHTHTHTHAEFMFLHMFNQQLKRKLLLGWLWKLERSLEWSLVKDPSVGLQELWDGFENHMLSRWGSPYHGGRCASKGAQDWWIQAPIWGAPGIEDMMCLNLCHSILGCYGILQCKELVLCFLVSDIKVFIDTVIYSFQSAFTDWVYSWITLWARVITIPLQRRSWGSQSCWKSPSKFVAGLGVRSSLLVSVP